VFVLVSVFVLVVVLPLVFVFVLCLYLCSVVGVRPCFVVGVGGGAGLAGVLLLSTPLLSCRCRLPLYQMML
jgi:L-cystine uptake protein TcyP (sodium:dicarboxylate symporter family)